MRTTKTILAIATFVLLTISAGSCLNLSGKRMNEKQQEPPCEDSTKVDEMTDTVGVKGYIIGDYKLFPELKEIWRYLMYGTATEDCADYFPVPELKYGEHTLVIIGGMVFFDTYDLNIDWETVRIIQGNEYGFTFTDEQFWYLYNGAVYKYDRNIPKPIPEETPEQTSRDRNALAGDFRVVGRVLYEDYYPVLESFDVKNLRTIRSASGFETDFITDGKKVLYAPTSGYSIEEQNGKEYVSIKDQIIEGVDLTSLRVLGKNILADKNALYYETSVTPFAELKGLKLILREQ